MGLGQYNSLGGPHTASSLFLIVFLTWSVAGLGCFSQELRGGQGDHQLLTVPELGDGAVRLVEAYQEVKVTARRRDVQDVAKPERETTVCFCQKSENRKLGVFDRKLEERNSPCYCFF